MENAFNLSTKDEVVGFVKAKINWRYMKFSDEPVYDGIQMQKDCSRADLESRKIDFDNRLLLDRFDPLFLDTDIDCWEGSVWWKDELEEGVDRSDIDRAGETTLDILTYKICNILGIGCNSLKAWLNSSGRN